MNGKIKCDASTQWHTIHLTSGWQLLINWLTGANQATDRRWPSGWQVLVNWLTGANQAADRRTSSCWQVLIKWLTGTCQTADKHWSGGCVGTAWGFSRHRSTGWKMLFARLSRCFSIGWLESGQVLIKRLTGADQAADRPWSRGWQVLIKLLTGAD